MTDQETRELVDRVKFFGELLEEYKELVTVKAELEKIRKEFEEFKQAAEEREDAIIDSHQYEERD